MSRQYLTTVTRKGQITVPAAIREQLQIERGDKIAVSILDGSSDAALLQRVRSVADATYGVAASRGPRPGPADARDAFEQGLAEDAMHGLDSTAAAQ